MSKPNSPIMLKVYLGPKPDLHDPEYFKRQWRSPFYELDKVKWYPHNIPDHFIVPFNENPIKKILLSGCTAESVYPYRKKFEKFSQKYPIDVLQFIGYRENKHE